MKKSKPNLMEMLPSWSYNQIYCELENYFKRLAEKSSEKEKPVDRLFRLKSEALKSMAEFEAEFRRQRFEHDFAKDPESNPDKVFIEVNGKPVELIKDENGQTLINADDLWLAWGRDTTLTEFLSTNQGSELINGFLTKTGESIFDNTIIKVK